MNQSMDRDKYELIVNDNTLVILLKNLDEHSLMVQRKFIIDMMNKGVNNPVIVYKSYDSNSILEFQLYCSIDLTIFFRLSL